MYVTILLFASVLIVLIGDSPSSDAPLIKISSQLADKIDIGHYSAVQGQTAVTAYLTSKQLLLSVFVQQTCSLKRNSSNC